MSAQKSSNIPSRLSVRWAQRRLMRNMLLVVVPLALVLSLFGWHWSQRRSQRILSEQMAHELAFIAQDDMLDNPSALTPSSLQNIFATLPDSPLRRELFAVDGNGQIVARAQTRPNGITWVRGSAETELRLNNNDHVGSAFRQADWYASDYSIYHLWQPDGAEYTLVAQSRASALNADAMRWMAPVLLAVVGTMLSSALVAYWLDVRRRRLMFKLAQASIDVTRGNYNRTMGIDGTSEYSELGDLLDKMRRSLKQRIDESALLLEVGQEVTGSMEIEQSMPVLLNGMLNGTAAKGARVIVVNPQGGRPLLFGSGEASKAMTPLDRRVLLQMRNSEDEFILRNPEQIRARLNLPDDRDVNVKALVAFPLFAQNALQGALWLGYGEELTHEPREVNLMRSFVTQASSVVANWRLYSIAEGERRRMAAVLGSIPDAVAITDQTHRFLMINPAMESIFDRRQAEVRSRLVEDVVTDEALIKVLTGNVEAAHGREISAENSKTYFTSVATAKGHNGQFMGRIAILHDITRLKQIDEMKSEFVASVSHDLRNPLAYMHTYASMLPELGELNEKQEQAAENIIHGIERMHMTIGELLDLNRIESEVDSLDLERIDVTEFLELLAAEHRPHAQANGNHLVVETPSEPFYMEADKWSLRLALNNLIGNALTYAPDTGDITISGELSNTGVVLSVSDNGPGISKSDQVRIFEKFYRASEPRTPKAEGSGLGLAIVKSVANRHGGRVGCESDLGQGCTFSLTIPQRESVGIRVEGAMWT